MQSFSMERHINGTLQSAVDAVKYDEYFETYNSSYQGGFQYYTFEMYLTYGFFLLICCMGFLGNGTVIWLLGFCIRRKPFTTYILNLAVADFAFLLNLAINIVFWIIYYQYVIYSIPLYLLAFTYNTGQLLLTAISIDRCVSVLFPIWHRCVRPTHLSNTVCALIWVLSFLLCLTLYIIEIIYSFPPWFPPWFSGAGQFLLTGMLCLPLMTISTVILFIKVCFKSHPRKRGRLLTVILLTLLFFLILAFPLNAMIFAMSIVNINLELRIGFYCASLNSSVNPLLYFLVGRKKGGRSRESLMVILQRALNEEENDRQEMDPHCSIPLRNLS